MARKLNESVDLESTIKTIVSDIGTPILQMYENIVVAARKYYNEDFDDKDRFGIIAAGHTGRWMQSKYEPSLHHQLNSLVKFKPRQTAQLSQFMKQHETKFGEIGAQLPPILIQIAKDIGSKRLGEAAQGWIAARTKAMSQIAEYKADAEAYNQGTGKYATEPKPAAKPKDTSAGQQNAQVDMIISDVLKNVQPKVAHEIRTALSRIDINDRLSALQKELTNRNISLNESAIRSIKRIASFNLDEAMIDLEKTMLYEGKLRKVEKQATKKFQTWAALDNNNSPYHAYRFGVSLAGSPSNTFDKDGPVGGQLVTLSYTDADDEIIKAAAKAMGVSAKSHGGKESKEMATNTKSPVAAIKRNKYGV